MKRTWRFGLGRRLAPWASAVLALAMVTTMSPARLQRVIGHALHALAVTPAGAAETMRFRPVPPESERVVDRRLGRVQRPAAADSTEETPPEAPVPPAAPGVIVTRSGDVMRVGSDIHVEKDEVVKGDVTAVKGDVVVDGHVEGNVVSMFGDVFLNATARVDGDVVCMRGELHEQPGAVVSGQRVTALGSEGRVRAWEREHRRHPHGGIGGFIAVWIVFVALAWGVSLLTPGRLMASLDTLREKPMLSFGLTMMVVALLVPSLVALCIVVALLCITVIGIPLALAALLGYWLFYVAMGIWGWTTGAAMLGRAIAARRGSTSQDVRSWALFGALALMTWILIGGVFTQAGAGGALGGLGVFLLVLGWIAFGILCWFGAGAWVRSEFTTGWVGRWWKGRRRRVPPAIPPGSAPPIPPAPVTGPEGPSPVVPPSPVMPPPPAVPPPPAAPAAAPESPPESYKPPGLEPPPTG